MEDIERREMDVLESIYYFHHPVNYREGKLVPVNDMLIDYMTTNFITRRFLLN